MRKITSPQGANAHRNGARAEHSVLEGIIQQGYTVYSNKEWRGDKTMTGVVVVNRPYHNIYGKKGRMEFYLPDWDTRVEVRSQSMAGSVSEKYAFLTQNARLYIHPTRTVLIALGKAIDDDIERWLQKEARELAKMGREFLTFRTCKEFFAWLRGMVRPSRYGLEYSNKPTHSTSA